MRSKKATASKKSRIRIEMLVVSSKDVLALKCPLAIVTNKLMGDSITIHRTRQAKLAGIVVCMNILIFFTNPIYFPLRMLRSIVSRGLEVYPLVRAVVWGHLFPFSPSVHIPGTSCLGSPIRLSLVWTVRDVCRANNKNNQIKKQLHTRPSADGYRPEEIMSRESHVAS